MARYFIHLSYNGTDFHGWQRQHNASSIQGTCEEALSLLLHDDIIQITGCGRTDAGVHARSYYAHFDTDRILPDEFIYRLNAILPKSIAVDNVTSVPDSLHARFDAIERTYKYFIHKKKNPFKENLSYALPKYELDITLMNDFCNILILKDDFSAFEKKGSDNKTSLCNLTHAYWEVEGDEVIFTITSDRFLRNMVRAIVGTCLMIGTKRSDTLDILRKVDNKEQINVTLPVPAHGLYLWDIGYDYIRNGRTEK